MNSMLWMGTGIARRATRHLFLHTLARHLTHETTGSQPAVLGLHSFTAQLYIESLSW